MKLTILVAAVLSQTSAQDFSGTWVAELAGTRFIRLELRASGDALDGRIALGNFHVTPTGEVDSATEAPAAGKPIFDVALKNAVLTFAQKDEHDTDRFEVRLAGAAAELHFILTEADRRTLAAEGVPIPKPVRLRKVGP